MAKEKNETQVEVTEVTETKKNNSGSGFFGTDDVTVLKMEAFVRKNRWFFIGGISALVIVIGGYFGYQEFVVKPRETNAQKAVYKPMLYYFERDSFKLAVEGTQGTMDDVKGLAAVFNEYGSTDAGKVAGYAAGISYLNIGDYDQAIAALSAVEFDDEEIMVETMRIGTLGDAHMEKGEVDKALDYYKQALGRYPNEFTTPRFLKKAAMVLETKGNHKEAFEMYKRIKDEFGASAEARVDIDKYISRAEHNANR